MLRKPIERGHFIMDDKLITIGRHHEITYKPTTTVIGDHNRLESYARQKSFWYSLMPLRIMNPTVKTACALPPRTICAQWGSVLAAFYSSTIEPLSDKVSIGENRASIPPAVSPQYTRVTDGQYICIRSAENDQKSKQSICFDFAFVLILF